MYLILMMLILTRGTKMDMTASNKTHSLLTLYDYDHDSTYNNRQFDGILSKSRHIYITLRHGWNGKVRKQQ